MLTNCVTKKNKEEKGLCITKNKTMNDRKLHLTYVTISIKVINNNNFNVMRKK